MISDTEREQCILLTTTVPKRPSLDVVCVFLICLNAVKTICLLHCCNQIVCICICGATVNKSRVYKLSYTPVKCYFYGLYLQRSATVIKKIKTLKLLEIMFYSQKTISGTCKVGHMPLLSDAENRCGLFLKLIRYTITLAKCWCHKEQHVIPPVCFEGRFVGPVPSCICT